MNLRDRLQAALGDSYRIERELGGGGMSHVFVAEETRLKRKVVVKLLPPEASAAVHADRFTREIELAASLSHPHIVPLLAAGDADGLLWYAMPFIEGESLADRIRREGALPPNDVVRIVRDVADALAEAHARGVVHRDIKPANILLRGRHALVADFGVAKALAAGQDSSGGDARTLTGLGIALGTPAYMAPEQAAADPGTDHRADIYALGVVAYEALSGRLPFDGNTAQELIAAHIAIPPIDIRVSQPSVTPELAEAIMRCLAKRPGDRWKSAEALATWCERQGTPSGGAGIDPAVTSAHRALNVWSKRRILSLYPIVAGVGVAATWLITRVGGLPDWIWWISAAMALLGLPVLWNAARHERDRARATLTGIVPSGALTAAAPWRSGRSAVRWGIGIAALVLLLGAGWVSTGALGIGPAATLLSSGAIGSGDRLLLADFDNRTTDSTLATSVVEALRVDLAQSGKVRLLEPTVVRAAMVRLGQNPATTKLLADAARDVATAEGAKAIVEGEVSTLGSSYVLTARLISTADGSTLASLKETAPDASELISAVNRLSRGLREKIGESLKSIRASEPLERATTGSLAALQFYSTGVKHFENGDDRAARQALESAIRADINFAMAYRKLAVLLNNQAIDRDLARQYAARAFELRDRLPPVERHLAEAYYYSQVTGDREAAMDAYRALLAIDPANHVAGNNLALQLSIAGQFAEANQVGMSVLSQTNSLNNWGVALWAAFGIGDTAAARSLSTRYLEQSGDTVISRGLAVMAANLGRDPSAVDSLVALDGERILARVAINDRAAAAIAQSHRYRGQLGEAGRRSAAESRRLLESGRRATALEEEWVQHFADLVATADTQAARAAVAEIERRVQADTLLEADVPWHIVAGIAALTGDPTATRRANVRSARHAEMLYTLPADSTMRRGLQAFADQSWFVAANAISKAHREYNCNPCGGYLAALAWERAGEPDSVRMILQGLVDRPRSDVYMLEDAAFYAPALFQLAELEAAAGDRTRAVEHYQRFIDYWRNADPVLQPRVARARQRLAEVSGEQ
jgi:tRNA A-37 threonylcarbamoyl transferase component Bud32/tetratricopeptide (TPR) repeat protein